MQIWQHYTTYLKSRTHFVKFSITCHPSQLKEKFYVSTHKSKDLKKMNHVVTANPYLQTNAHVVKACSPMLQTCCDCGTQKDHTARLSKPFGLRATLKHKNPLAGWVHMCSILQSPCCSSTSQSLSRSVLRFSVPLSLSSAVSFFQLHHSITLTLLSPLVTIPYSNISIPWTGFITAGHTICKPSVTPLHFFFLVDGKKNFSGLHVVHSQ